jgi:VCBS repeat-containing protein
LPLDGYGIVGLSLSDDRKVLIGQLKGGYSANLFDSFVQKPNQNHAWGVDDIISAALAMTEAQRESKHIVLPTNAEQLIPMTTADATGWVGVPAGTAFDPETVYLNIEDARMGDVIEIDLKRRVAYGLLRLPAPAAGSDPQLDSKQVKAVMANLKEFKFEPGVKEQLTSLLSAKQGMTLATEANGAVLSRQANLTTATFADEGRMYLTPKINAADLEKLRNGEALGEKYSHSILSYQLKQNMVEFGLDAGEGKIDLKVTAHDFGTVANTFFGDRPLDNPGYSELKLKGAVGMNVAKPDRLDVYKVEQRLKYLGFPAMGLEGGTAIALNSPLGQVGVPKEFIVDGTFGDEEERALRGFYATTHYLYNTSSNSNGIQQATSTAAKTVTAGNTGNTNFGWLNAFNAPHWMNFYGRFNIPLSGNNATFSNGQQMREIYTTSWMTDLVTGWVNLKGLQGLTTGGMQVNGLTDPAYLFATHAKGGHSVGMGLDLGFGQRYIYPDFQNPIFDQTAPQMTGTGWSVQNAIDWSNLLPNANGNNQAGALGNFLSLYALTIGDAVPANGTYEELTVVNGDAVKKALFGSGLQDSKQLIQNVWIGGDEVKIVNKKTVTTAKNKYQAINAVLGRLGFNSVGLNHGTSPSHFNHFHVDIRAPERVDLPKKLVLDESASAQPNAYQLPSVDEIGLTALPPDLERDFAMLAYDLLDVPPTHVTQVVVRADSAGASSPTGTVRSMGECVVVSNYPSAEVNGQNSLTPDAAIQNYFYTFERKKRIDTSNAKITFVTQPQHGEIIQKPDGLRYYKPKAGYLGKDRVEALVDAAGYKVRIFYDIQAVNDDLGNDWETVYCPKGLFWKISQPDFNPGATDLGAWLRSSDLMTALANASSAFTFSNLPGPSLGTTVGEGATAQITLDTDAAGHGWYVGATPLDNTDDYLPTSDPSVWQAKAGSAADGKMDLLSVLLHEYGHALGLDHSVTNSDFMAASLQPGQRKLPSAQELGLMAQLVAQLKGEATSAPVDPDPQSPDAPTLPIGIALAGLLGARRKADTSSASALTIEKLLGVNPTLQDADFNQGTQGWDSLGSITTNTDTSSVTLAETTDTQTSLSQAFTLGANDRFLSFTVDQLELHGSGTELQSAPTGPSDAFEVALLDATTYQPLLDSANGAPSGVGGLGWTHSDAALNLQHDASGALVEHKTQGIRSVLNADGSTTYTLDLRFLSVGSSVLLAFDLLGFGAADSKVTLRNIHLGAVPIAVDDAVTTAEDTPVTIAALANDVDATQPGYVPVIVSGAQHGSVTVNADGTFTYTPDANYFGADSFSYGLGDGSQQSNSVTVSINVTPVNDAPIVQDSSAQTAEDTPLTLSLLTNAVDVDGDSLTLTFSSSGRNAPAHGRLTPNPDGSLSYTPDADYFGQDSFSYEISDGQTSTYATVQLTITPVNDAPTLTDVSLTLSEDSSASLNLLAGARDVEGNSLTPRIIRATSHGQLSLSADGRYAYTSDADYFGADSFSYTVNDGALDSNVATVTINVTPVNDAPIAGDISITTAEDTAATIGLVATDVDNAAAELNFTIVVGPQHGTVTLNANGSATFLPAANYFGADSFTYKVNDGSLDSAVATVTINVTPVNDAPIAGNITVTTAEDTATTISLMASDVDNTAAELSFAIVTGPQHGSLTLNANGTVTYVPAANYFGTDSFSYKVNDGSLNSNIATVSITVTPVNDTPIWTSTAPTSFTLTTGNSRIYQVAGNAGITTSLNFVFAERHAAYNNEIGVYRVDDAAGRIGALNPGDAGYAQAALAADRATVIFASGASQGLSKTLFVAAGQFYGIYLIQNASTTAWRRLNPENKTTKTPQAFFSVQAANSDHFDHLKTSCATDKAGNAGLTLKWEDLTGGGDHDYDDAIINVKGFKADSTGTAQTFVYQAQASDVDGDTLSYSLSQAPAGAAIDASTGRLTWANPTVGQHSFVIKVSDGKGASASQSFVLNVTGPTRPNTAPKAEDAWYGLNRNASITIDLRRLISDAENDALTITLNNPAHGTLTKNADGTYTYKPNRNYVGLDEFSYTVSDGRLSTTAKVSLWVLGGGRCGGDGE